MTPCRRAVAATILRTVALLGWDERRSCARWRDAEDRTSPGIATPALTAGWAAAAALPTRTGIARRRPMVIRPLRGSLLRTRMVLTETPYFLAMTLRLSPLRTV